MLELVIANNSILSAQVLNVETLYEVLVSYKKTNNDDINSKPLVTEAHDKCQNQSSWMILNTWFAARN